MAVVAVDPTSPFTGGALLGDRIRMESIALDQGVYIRSMASRGSLGGLATTTREVCDLLDAAGFDRILVETVGVGQSELDVGRMADSTVLVLVPESGDGIQTLKSGVMEIADVFVVNKADRPGAESCDRRSRSRWGSGGATRFGTCGRTMGGRTVRPAAAVAAAPSRPVRPPARPSRRAWEQPVVLTSAAKGEGHRRSWSARWTAITVARARPASSSSAGGADCSTDPRGGGPRHAALAMGGDPGGAADQRAAGRGGAGQAESL